MPLSGDAAQHYSRLRLVAKTTFKSVIVENEPVFEAEPEFLIVYKNENVNTMTLDREAQEFIYHAHQYMKLEPQVLKAAFRKFKSHSNSWLTPEKAEAVIQFMLDAATYTSLVVYAEAKDHLRSVMEYTQQMENKIRAILAYL